MSGIEIERMLKMIDANLDATSRAVNSEILKYIADHQDDVATELLKLGQVSIPTSVGPIVISRSALEGVAA